MDNRQACFLLRSYRPGGADAADPFFAEALALAQRDPAVAAWLKEEQALDALIAAKLGEIAPPPELRAALAAATRPQRPALRRLRAWTGWLALAAAVAVLAAVGLGGLHPSFKSYEGDLVGQIASGQVNDLKLVDPRLPVLKEWLARNHAPAQLDIPAGTDRLPSVGCRAFAWRGRTIAQICFAQGDGQIVHLFVIRQADWRAAPPEGRPQFSSHGDWTLASWRDGADTYVMARLGSADDLHKLFF